MGSFLPLWFQTHNFVDDNDQVRENAPHGLPPHGLAGSAWLSLAQLDRLVTLAS